MARIERRREQLLNELKKAIVHLGRVDITLEEAEMHSDLDNANDLAFYCGSFSEACKIAWSEIQQERAAEQKGVDMAEVRKQRIQESAKKMKQDALIDWLIAEHLKTGQAIQPLTIKKQYPEKYRTALELFGMWSQVEYAMRAEMQRREEKEKSEDEPEVESVVAEELTAQEAMPEVAEGSAAQEPTVKTEKKPRRRRVGRAGVGSLITYLLKVQEELGEMPSMLQLETYVQNHEEAYTYTALVRHLGPKAKWPEILRRARAGCAPEECLKTDVEQGVTIESIEENKAEAEVIVEMGDEAETETQNEAETEAETETETETETGAEKTEIIATETTSFVERTTQRTDEDSRDDVRHIEVTLRHRGLAFRVDLDGQKFEITLNLE